MKKLYGFDDILKVLNVIACFSIRSSHNNSIHLVNLKSQVNEISDNLENNIEKFIEKNMPSKVFK